MAYDSVRAMMDQLMGADRDATAEEKQRNKRSFDDPEIDTFYLCGLSPYKVLSETKSSDMVPGNWNKIQDVTLRNEWAQLPQEEKDKYGYEYELKEVCARLVAQMDQRIAQNKAKIAGETVLAPEHQAEVDRMDAQIRDLQSRAEGLGEEGDIDGSTQMLHEAQTLKAQRDMYEQSNKPKARRDFVCPVSGVIYSSGDAETQRRVEEGRQWQAWKQIRDKLTELTAKDPPKAAPRQRAPPPDRDSRPERRERSPRAHGDRDRDRDRDRRRDRSRSRDRRRDSRRDRSRSRDRRRDSRRDSRRD